MILLRDDLLFAIHHSKRPLDEGRIQKAWEFANLAHTGQKRNSGDDYITHPAHVAKTLIDWNLDTVTIIAGLLHDTVENGGATADDLLKEFGPDVAQIVAGVTKITDIHLVASEKEQFVENLRKMILVMAHDLRVVLVKLADRLHNMQTLQYLSPEKQIENAKETLEIYAPLAERLGIGQVKGELEDLSFKYVYPEDYKKTFDQTKHLYAEASKYLEKFRREILKLLSPSVKDVAINIRQKRLYSLWRKMYRPEHAGDIDKVHDLVAARILVHEIEDCYRVLGLIHSHYRPVPYLGMRDFIANPKANGYRSIHINVFGPEGRIVEIQIRTFQMHAEAEMGVAAHWQYAAAKSKGEADEKLEKGTYKPAGSKLSWVKQLANWQNEVTDSEEYLRSLKFDAFAHRNLVFSPIGDVYDLPRGATPIDYAYAVHTQLGNQAAGAKVNGKMVPLSHRLGNGDVVEIIIDRKRKLPSHEWLDFVVTTTARQQIQKFTKMN